jgi:hypothetical protein
MAPALEFDLRSASQRKADRRRVRDGIVAAGIFLAWGLGFLLVFFAEGPWTAMFPDPGLQNLSLLPIPVGFLFLGIVSIVVTLNFWRHRPFRLWVSVTGITILDHAGDKRFTSYDSPAIDSLPWFRPNGPAGARRWNLTGRRDAIWIPPAAVAIIRSRIRGPDPEDPVYR